MKKVVNGKIRNKVDVWYYGIDTQTYIKDDAGAIFELRHDDETIYASLAKTFGRL